MQKLAAPTLAADEISAALLYLRHFAEPFDHGAMLCRPDGERIFIPAETLRATQQTEAAR